MSLSVWSTSFIDRVAKSADVVIVAKQINNCKKEVKQINKGMAARAQIHNLRCSLCWSIRKICLIFNEIKRLFFIQWNESAAVRFDFCRKDKKIKKIILYLKQSEIETVGLNQWSKMSIWPKSACLFALASCSVYVADYN